MMDEVLEYVTKNVKKTTRLGGLVEVSTILKGPNATLLRVAFQRNSPFERTIFAAVRVKAGWRAYPAMTALPVTRTNSRGRVCDALYSDAEALRAVRRIFAEAYPGSE